LFENITAKSPVAAWLTLEAARNHTADSVSPHSLVVQLKDFGNLGQ
jgi:hypothetical protein